MKYLILENHNEFYNEISSDEYDLKASGFYIGQTEEQEEAYIEENWDEFTKKEIDTIKSLFVSDETFGGYREYDFVHYPSSAWRNHARGRLDIVQKIRTGNSTRMIIIKLKDEWYYICDMHPYYKIGEQVGSKYYACDQFEGLLKCLEDKV